MANLKLLRALLILLFAAPAFAAQKSIPELSRATASPSASAAAGGAKLGRVAAPRAAANDPKIAPAAAAQAPQGLIKPSEHTDPLPSDEAGIGRSLGQVRRAIQEHEALYDGSKTAAEAEKVYAEAFPNSETPRVIANLGRPGQFGVKAADLVNQNIYNSEKMTRRGLESSVHPGLPERSKVIDALVELTDFIERAPSDGLADRFVRLLAQSSAQKKFQHDLEARGVAHELPPNPLKGGEYWDLATGPGGTHLMLGKLDPKTSYKFFDVAPFSVHYLEESKRLMDAHGLPTANIEILKADVRQLARPPTPLSVLRNKNVHTYVPGFEKQFEQMADWVAEGGAVIIDADPSTGQRMNIIEKLGPMIERLLDRGWKLSFSGFSERRGGMDSLTLIRPAGDKPLRMFQRSRADADSKRVWAAYKKDVSEMARDPMRMLMEMLSR